MQERVMILRIVDNDDHSFIASKTLDALQQVEANFQGRRFLFRSKLTAHASQAIRAIGVTIPPTLRELQ
jgi:hypothetical protein